MQPQTRQSIYELLRAYARKSFKKIDPEVVKRGYPFHRLFFDDAGIVAFKRKRSVVSGLGSIYPRLAKLIADETYKDVVLEKVIEVTLDENKVNVINQIVRDLRTRLRKPNHAQEIGEIETAVGGVQVPIRIIADFYVGDFKGGPLFVEIKTSKPNLDICAESKSKILTFDSIDSSNNQGFLAFAYNPYLTREQYKHFPVKQIMDLPAEVLMGEEFWNMIGDEQTFDELLRIIEQIGDEMRSEIA